jgi:hypothetical protein
MAATDGGTSSEPRKWVRTIALGAGATFLFLGLWALISPRSFFTSLATFDPYNVHLLHDIGSFQIGIGMALLLAAFPARFDGLSSALLGAAAGSVAHVVSHVLDVDRGGSPSTDIPILTILGSVLLVAGAAHTLAQGRTNTRS